MITFVTGKPGDGKSMYGMRLMTRSLLESERVIITNIPVREPELRAYLARQGWSGDLNERLLLLRHEEVFEFYRFRSGRYVLPPSPDWIAAREGERGRKLPRPAFIDAMQAQLDEMKKHPEACLPCEYHIDEAHDYFSAREWADTGRGVLWYASKHRHLHDECIFYSQVMGNVEKQLRGLASETVRVRNQMRMSWGPFRKAPIFRTYHYYGAPEKTENAVPFNQGVMTLDVKGLASTYNSAGALSVHATPEKVTNRAPLPYWALPVAACVVIVLVGALFALAPVTVGKWAGKKIASAPVESLAKSAGVSLPGSPFAPRPGERPAAQIGGEKLVVTGVMMRGNTLWVSVFGRGWQRAVGRTLGGAVLLEDGSAVEHADVLTGGGATSAGKDKSGGS